MAQTDKGLSPTVELLLFGTVPLTLQCYYFYSFFYVVRTSVHTNSNPT